MAKKKEVEGIEVPKLEAEEVGSFDSDYTAAFEEAVIDPMEKKVATSPDEARLAEEAKTAEEARLAEEAKTAEEAKLAEEAKTAEEAKKVVVDPKISALEAKIADLEKQVAKPSEKEQSKGPSPEEVEASKKDEAAYSEFEKEWPIHAQAMKVQEKRILSAVESALDKIMAPIMQQLSSTGEAVAKSAEEKAIEAVKAVHADAFDLMPQIEEWILTLPKFMQASANGTLDNGTPKDVIDLFNVFKKETGRLAVESREGTEEKKLAEEARLATEKEQKVAAEKERVTRLNALTPAKTSRTGVAVLPDKNDFDSAFKEALDAVI